MKFLSLCFGFVCLFSVMFGGVSAGQATKLWEAPVPLMVGDVPMNADGRMAYPSPAIFDIDGDGLNELVMGTIFGAIFSCENSNQGKSGDPVWGSPKAVQAAHGKPLRLNNW